MTLIEGPAPAPDPQCLRFVSWWGGEYEGNCQLAAGHDGDHWDGMSWYDDGENDDGFTSSTDHLHDDGV